MTKITKITKMANITTMTNNHIDCLGVVLAGGLSSRMGQDKAKLMRAEHSMLSFSKQLLHDAGLSNVVVSGDNYDIADTIKNCGPVGGIVSVLAAFPQAKSLLILPVDLPLMTASALRDLRLKGQLSHKASYFTDHHIPLYLPNNAYLAMFLAQHFTGQGLISSAANGQHQRFASKGPSMKHLITSIPHQGIIAQDRNTLFNSNTPAQWQQVKKQLHF